MTGDEDASNKGPRSEYDIVPTVTSFRVSDRADTREYEARTQSPTEKVAMPEGASVNSTDRSETNHLDCCPSKSSPEPKPMVSQTAVDGEGARVLIPNIRVDDSSSYCQADIDQQLRDGLSKTDKCGVDLPPTQSVGTDLRCIIAEKNTKVQVVINQSPANVQDQEATEELSGLGKSQSGIRNPQSSLMSHDVLSDCQARQTLMDEDIASSGIKDSDTSASGSEKTPFKKRRRKRQTGQISQHFKTSPSVKHKRAPAGTLSCISFPPLSATCFGLVQEQLAHDPFQLLVAVTFLNKTRGSVALPVFHRLMEHYPTPEALSQADPSEIAAIIHRLGLQNSRARILTNLAMTWIVSPPVKGQRYRTLNYPAPGAGKGLKRTDVVGDEDERLGAWEIAHLPGCGPYAIDSWRIFCRDRLRGLADGYNGEGANEGFEPEWKRVVPMDKELRAFLRWMWLREGWAWDPLTGDKEVASTELMKQAAVGRAAWHDPEGRDVKIEEILMEESQPSNDLRTGVSSETPVLTETVVDAEMPPNMDRSAKKGSHEARPDHVEEYIADKESALGQVVGAIAGEIEAVTIEAVGHDRPQCLGSGQEVLNEPDPIRSTDGLPPLPEESIDIDRHSDLDFERVSQATSHSKEDTKRADGEVEEAIGRLQGYLPNVLSSSSSESDDEITYAYREESMEL